MSTIKIEVKGDTPQKDYFIHECRQSTPFDFPWTIICAMWLALTVGLCIGDIGTSTSGSRIITGWDATGVIFYIFTFVFSSFMAGREW